MEGDDRMGGGEMGVMNTRCLDLGERKKECGGRRELESADVVLC
jgi:hypothetical protein